MNNNELTKMLQVFFECNKNRLQAVHRYSVRFPDREISDSKIFQRIETNLRNYGSFKKPKTRKCKFSEDKELDVLLAVQENSRTSTRKIAHNIGVSKNNSSWYFKKAQT
ncbi:winged helix-turn-helix dna-binding [Holotrichia oblita]|uniref:Winged helix-turn-helix dna-binding n=1 Tax=Holotrichia oblita TaxID=644536 RepID=A0ACB9TRU1_HOLOL|nr:winged helix-turn-helix dna-binding [Holotrichia oblita]